MLTLRADLSARAYVHVGPEEPPTISVASDRRERVVDAQRNRLERRVARFVAWRRRWEADSQWCGAPRFISSSRAQLSKRTAAESEEQGHGCCDEWRRSVESLGRSCESASKSEANLKAPVLLRFEFLKA